MPTGIKLKYNPKRRTIRVSFTVEDCARFPEPPTQLIDRACKRLEKARADGLIKFYVTYDDRLRRTWHALAAQPPPYPGSKIPYASQVSVVIAAGCPDLQGLEVEPANEDGVLAKITFNASKTEVKTWRYEWVLLHVEKKLAELDILGRPNPAQLRAEVYRARCGIPVQKASLYSLYHLLQNVVAQGRYNLLHNRARGEIDLVIHDLSNITNLEIVKKRLNRITDRIKAVPESDKSRYKIFKIEIAAALARAKTGPQSLGLDMPIVILAAIRTSPRKEITKAKAIETKTSATVIKAVPRPPAPIQFAISADRMKATITHADKQIYATNYTVDINSIRSLARQAGIIFGTRDDLIKSVLDRIIANDDIKGCVIAEGQIPIAGKKPYLVDLSSGLAAPLSDNGGSNVRAYRQHLTVKIGQVVAEIRYDEPLVNGSDVTGQITPPTGNEDFPVKVGEGIERRTDDKFYAMADGLYVNDPDQGLYLKKALLHTGDVNFASGNISFDGPVEIKGDIDNGVTVFAGGDLTIHGEIRGGFVYCNASIAVERGIVLGATGAVNAKGDIKADFIENATVVCGGTLRVTKSILSSRVMAGIGIEIESASGLLSGGTFTCGDLIKSAKIGLNDGAKTEINAGVDVKMELALSRRNKRFETLTAKAAEERLVLKELTKKRPNQLTKANKELKIKLTKRIAKWKRIIERAEQAVQKINGGKSNYSPNAKIYVKDQLSPNCIIKIGGHPVPIDQPRTSVLISSNSVNGSYIQPYSGDAPSTAPVESEAPPAAEEPKKAS